MKGITRKKIVKLVGWAFLATYLIDAQMCEPSGWSLFFFAGVSVYGLIAINRWIEGNGSGGSSRSFRGWWWLNH